MIWGTTLQKFMAKLLRQATVLLAPYNGFENLEKLFKLFSIKVGVQHIWAISSGNIRMSIFSSIGVSICDK
jgi:ketopantoate reductase